MFDQMRHNTKTILWITVAAFLGLIFLAWGADFQVKGKRRADPNTIGNINGTPVTSQAFEQAVLESRARYQQQAGRDLDDRTEVMIRNQTWNELVQETLLRQEVLKRGITVSDDEVVQAVLNQPPPDVVQSPNFQTNGQFDLSKYQAALRSPGVDTRSLEAQYRSNIPLQKLQMLVVGTVAVSDQELFDAYALQNDKVKISYLMIPAAKFNVDEAAIGQADLDGYYQAHLSTYKQQPSAVLEYISIPRRYTQQDSLNLIDQGGQVLAELKGGEDFGVLVDAYSEAPANMRGGNNAAFLPATQIQDSAVRAAAFSLAIGQTSDLLVTGNGVHLIRLLDKKTDPAGDQVKIADIYMALKPSPETLTQLRDTATQFRTEVEKRSFAEVAAEMKLSVKETNPFNEGGFISGLGQAPELQDFAFRFPVGTISPPVERPEGWTVARIRERRDARIAELKEVLDRVRREVADSMRVDQAAQVAQTCLQRAQSGAPLSQIAPGEPRAMFSGLEPSPRLGFQGIGNDPKVVGPIFAAEIGLYPKVIRGRNAAFVVQVEQKIPADRTQFETQKQQQRQSLVQRKQSQLMNDWMAELKKNAKIEDYRFGLYNL